MAPFLPAPLSACTRQPLTAVGRAFNCLASYCSVSTPVFQGLAVQEKEERNGKRVNLKSPLSRYSDFHPFFQENKDFDKGCRDIIGSSSLWITIGMISCVGPRGSLVLFSGTLWVLLNVGCLFVVDVRILASCPYLTTSSQPLEF